MPDHIKRKKLSEEGPGGSYAQKRDLRSSGPRCRSSTHSAHNRRSTHQTTSRKQSVNANAAKICILAFDVVGLALVEIHLVIWRFAPVRTDTLIIGLIRNNWHR